MRAHQILLAAASLVALRAEPTAAQATLRQAGSGPLTAAMLAADGFTPRFSFRLTGLAPDGASPALMGGFDDCLPGAPCQTSTGHASSGAVVPSTGATYRMGASYFPRFGGGPHFGVVNPGQTSEAHLELDPASALPPASINAFYIVLRGGAPGALRVTDLTVASISPDVSAPVVDHPVAFDETVAGPGAIRFAGFDLHGNHGGGFALSFQAITSDLAAGGGSPTIDVYFGTVTTTPEPATTALLGAGLLTLGALAWRRRVAGA